MVTSDTPAASTNDDARRRWRFVRSRRAVESCDAEYLGWSHVLLGTDAVTGEDRAEIRERAIQAWLADHGIDAAPSDARPRTSEPSVTT